MSSTSPLLQRICTRSPVISMYGVSSTSPGGRQYLPTCVSAR